MPQTASTSMVFTFKKNVYTKEVLLPLFVSVPVLIVSCVAIAARILVPLFMLLAIVCLYTLINTLFVGAYPSEITLQDGKLTLGYERLNRLPLVAISARTCDLGAQTRLLVRRLPGTRNMFVRARGARRLRFYCYVDELLSPSQSAIDQLEHVLLDSSR